MLSPGKYHERVPRTLHANLIFRRKILELAENDPDVQDELRRMCRADVLFHINCMVWQYNPSMSVQGEVHAIYPFITYPAQERLIVARPETHREFAPYDKGMLWCIEHNKTGVCEKSRWQGASWLCLMVEDWICGFHGNMQVLNISRNEDAVDDGTKDSLFWKIRYMHDNYPDWLLGRVEQSKLFFGFGRTGSEITGTATTKKAGVGGRASWIVADEFPEIEQGQAIREKTALTANSRLFVGTHLGVGTPFQVMCDPKKSPEIVRMRLHWTDNPEQFAGAYEFDESNPTKPIVLDKNYKYPHNFRFVLDGTPVAGPRPGVRSPWYDRKCVEIGDTRAIAMNLDISPEGAARQFFDPLKVRNYITNVCREPVWTGEVDYDPAGRFRGLMPDPKGRLRLWIPPVTDGHSLPKSSYCVGADICAGTGATPSCFTVIDGKQSLKVAEYTNPWIEEREYAQLVVAVCNWLVGVDGRGAWLVWDSSGQQGVKFETEVMRLGYPYIYHDGDDLAHLFPRGSQRRRPGWYSSNPQKYAVLKDYRQALYDRALIDRSELCLLETLLFEYDQKSGVVQHSGETRTNDPTGARKNHGDLVTSAAIAWMLAKEMAEGGRLNQDPGAGRPQPNTLEWMIALQAGRETSLLEHYE